MVYEKLMVWCDMLRRNEARGKVRGCKGIMSYYGSVESFFFEKRGSGRVVSKT